MQSRGRAEIFIVAAIMLLVTSLLLAQGPNRNLGNNIPIQPAEDTPRTGPPKAGDISVDVNVVNMDVVVMDRNGNPIGGMERQHFKVFDDNVEQKITAFTTVETPLTVVIVVEFTPFTVYYENIYSSVGGFVQSLRDTDWAALVAYGANPMLITDFTRNKNQLFDGLRSLRNPTNSERGMYDAIYDTLQKLEKVDGKKAIFLLSTGLDSISRHTYGETLKKAQGSETMIYAVGLTTIYRLYNPNLRIDDSVELTMADNQLNQFATATGGSAFFPRFESEYPDIYQSMSNQLRNQYNLSFISQKKDGKLHKIRVDVQDLDVNKDGKPDGLKAHTRQGYYAPKQ